MGSIVVLGSLVRGGWVARTEGVEEGRAVFIAVIELLAGIAWIEFLQLLCGNDTLEDDVYESECRPGCCLDGSGGELLKTWL